MLNTSQQLGIKIAVSYVKYITTPGNKDKLFPGVVMYLT
jgi:hypothetical protein